MRGLLLLAEGSLLTHSLLLLAFKMKDYSEENTSVKTDDMN